MADKHYEMRNRKSNGFDYASICDLFYYVSVLSITHASLKRHRQRPMTCPCMEG